MEFASARARMRRGLFPLVALFVILIASASSVLAQTAASIKGTVTDASGAAVAGAQISVKNSSLGIERKTETNSSGDYEVPALPPGTYSVEVDKSGFQKQKADSVVIAVSQNALQNFSLSVASTSEVLIVESSQPVIDATSITVGQVIDKEVVQEIPLNGRHFVDLALLVPGTVTPPQNGFLTAPLRGQGSFAFNSAGGREDAVNFMINGINLNDMVQNQVTFQPTINTVSEFKIDNSTYSAEYGRNSGSIVNIATRSGSEQFHGEAYDYFRNNDLDARNFFNNAGTQPQSTLKRNQFGGDFGGPIVHGKTFFFASYEGLRHRQGLNTASNVLSDAQRTQIQSGNNAVAQALLNLIPVANGAQGTTPAFFGTASANVNIDQGTIDISHNFSDKDRIHGYYVDQDDFRQEPTQGANIPGFGDTRQGHRQVLTLNETHVFSSALVNEARLGANRIHILFNPINATDPNSVGLAGVLGANQVFLPTIRIQDLGLLFGDERNFPQGRGDTTFALADTLNYIRGSHSLKFGVEFRDFRNNNFNTDPGQLVFNTTNNFINGVVDTSARTLNSVASRITENALEFFVQDSYKIKPSLTLELGLRYSWNKTPNEAEGRFVNFDLTSGSLVRVSDPYNQNDKNFQPRVGFAWNVLGSNKTVLRGAYGYQVDEPITGFVTTLASNPPFDVPIAVNSATPIGTLGALYNPANASNLSPVLINPDFKNAYVQSWNLNVQHQLRPTLGIMVGYFGNKGTHLEVDRNANEFQTLGVAASRPFPAISATSAFFPGTSLSTSLSYRDSSANSTYNALWVTANKTFSRGVQFNASYTYSHSIDDASRNLEGILVQDSNNITGSRGSSDFDVRHRFVVNTIYSLPFKANRLVSGWEVAGIISAQSGNPFNVVLATATVNGVANTVRPNLIGPVHLTGDPLQWISNPAATFAAPAAGTFGNLGRNAIYGPGFTDVDLSLVKNTKLTERVNLQFRADAFDLFNHPNFGQPGPVAANGSSIITFNTVGGVTTVPATFSRILSTRFPTADSGSSRQLQLALKLQF